MPALGFRGNASGAFRAWVVGRNRRSVGIGSRSRQLVLLTGLCLTFAAPAMAQSPGAPSNDNFAAPADLGAGTTATVSGSTIDATKETGEPRHANTTGSASVWYRWTAPRAGRFTIDLCASGFDTLLGVYTGSAVGGLTSVASNNNACGPGGSRSRVNFQAVAGQSYRIAVDGSGTSKGTVQLGIVPAAPTNDRLSNAQSISGTTASVTGTNFTASKETGEPSHAGNLGGASVWYRWTAPSTGPYTIDLCGSGFDSLLGVYTGSSIAALTQVASNDDGCGAGGRSRLSFQATGGVTYRIAVDGSNSGGGAPAAQGTIDLRLRATPPANDSFAAARDLGGGSEASASATNVGATSDPGEPQHNGIPGGGSIWFRWTAPAAGFATLDLCGSSFDTVLAVYTGSAVSGLSPVAGNDNGAACGLDSSATFIASGGTTYSFAVDGRSSSRGTVQLKLVLESAANDSPQSAIDIGSTRIVSSLGSNERATKEAWEPSYAGDPGGASVWYRWTPETSGSVTLDTCDSDFDTLLGVYTDGEGGLNQIATDDNGCDPQSYLNFPAVAGTTYWIVVDGALASYGSPSRGSIALRLMQAPELPPPPGKLDNTPPETKITKGPKSAVRSGSVGITFASSEERSRFECALDRQRFKRCESPARLKVKPGRHSFRVRAIDPAGNFDASPARQSWTRKRPAGKR